MQKDNPTDAHAPTTTTIMLRNRCAASPVTMDKAVAMIGVINGAMIIAPITVAVESPTTPPGGDHRGQHKKHAEPHQGVPLVPTVVKQLVAQQFQVGGTDPAAMQHRSDRTHSIRCILPLRG